MKILSENYDLCFVDEAKAKETFTKLNEADKWVDVTAKKVSAIPIENLPIFIHKIREEACIPEEVTDESVVECMDSVNLGIKFPLDGIESCYPVAMTGYMSLLQRAGYQSSTALAGTEFKKEFSPMEPEKKALVLNYGFETQGNKTIRALVRDEKIRYLASDEYSKLPFSLLLSALREGLEKNFKDVEFESATVNHEYMNAMYTVKDDFLDEEMKDILARAGIRKAYSLGVRLTSSDVGLSGANLYPFIVGDSKRFAIGKPVSLEHKGGHNVEDFLENVNKIFAIIRESEHALEDMSLERIKNPAGAFRRVCKAVGLPKKVCMDASFRFEKMYANPTFLDVYFAVYEVFDEYVSSASVSQSYTLTLEEGIARLLYSKRSEYDSPFEWA